MASSSATTLSQHLDRLASTANASSSSIQSDDLLDAFLEAQKERGVTLYPAQEEALLELVASHHVILGTPTGSGKSLVAMFLHFLSLGQKRRSFYTCPIKALVSEKFFDLCRAFGADNVGMLTGDASINPHAPIICCTAEVLAQMSLHADASRDIGDVVMDEFHYFGDTSRGRAWQIPLIALPNTRFLLMSATLGDVSGITTSLKRDTGRHVAEVMHAERPVPLDFTYSETPLTETLAQLLAGGGAPIYVVHFTQRDAVEAASAALSTDVLTKAQKIEIAAAIGAFRFDTPFGKTVSRALHHGVGIHHAGLLPKYRLLTEKLAQKGLLRILMGTDTLGVGINVPIRTVVFTQLCKYDGQATRILSVRDFKQIAGRAGRAGFDDQGSVVCQAPEHVIENRRMVSRVGDDPKKLRKLVKKKPPQKNFVPWDATSMQRLIDSPPEPLESQFHLDFALVLEAMRHHPHGYRHVVRLIDKSHNRPKQKRDNRRQGRVIFRTLRQAGVLKRQRDENLRVRYELDAALGEDFSLTHTLSLFVLDTLPLLMEQPETSPLDILSLVESILENPFAILNRQTDLLRRRKLEELKAQGVPFEDRITELDTVTYEKPLADTLYPLFNAWQERHPAARELNVAPKSIARAMAESFATFNDYVRELGLERAEGVLLRYLSQTLDALAGTIAPAQMNEGLTELVAYLEECVQQVDASLTTEWERLAQGLEDKPERSLAPPPTPLMLLRRQPKIITARIRQRLFLLVKALGNHAWQEAVDLLKPPFAFADSQEPQEAQHALEQWVLELEATSGAIDTSPQARLGSWSRIQPADNGRFAVSYTLLHQGEPIGRSLELTVDVSDLLDAQNPALCLMRLAGD